MTSRVTDNDPTANPWLTPLDGVTLMLMANGLPIEAFGSGLSEITEAAETELEMVTREVRAFERETAEATRSLERARAAYSAEPNDRALAALASAQRRREELFLRAGQLRRGIEYLRAQARIKPPRTIPRKPCVNVRVHRHARAQRRVGVARVTAKATATGDPDGEPPRPRAFDSSIGGVA